MGVVAGRAAILEDEGLEEGAQRDEDDDEERQHHADLVKMGIAGQAEQRVQDELHGAGEDHADDQEQDRDLEQMEDKRDRRSEEHTSELQSLKRISYAAFCLKKKN